MSFTIPVINLTFSEVKGIIWEKIQEPIYQRRLVLIIVSIALLLDNMLYMVIVPIIPDYLQYIASLDDNGDPIPTPPPPRFPNGTLIPKDPNHHDHHGQDSATGILFASKAIVQLMVNPFSGALIDRIGYDIPMMIGLTIMFFSTAVFACGKSYSVLFFARSLQGAGSAFADTSGLAMIADRFTEENERSKALGIALAFISFGCLVAPPFGGALYQFAGKEVPFLILAFVCLIDGTLLLLVMKPIKQQLSESREVQQETIPIWKLLMDPYIAVCAGALTMSNVALAFIEPTISLWMEDTMTTDNWKIGMIWLPAFFPHVFGVVITVKMAREYPHHQWLMAAGGLALEGLCCFIIPFSSSYKVLMIPICGICFGIALIDTALLPTLGYLVDVRYVSVYGSIYAIADISYSIAYAVGPIIAGGVVELIGFTALNFIIAFTNLLYVPVLGKLRNIYDFKPFESEANILMSDPPKKEYQTYSMQDQQPIDGDFKNHLEYGYQQQQDGAGVAETNVDNEQYNQQQQYQYQGGYQQQQQYQPGYQEQGGIYQQQQQQDQQRHLPPSSQQQANPFRHGAPQVQPQGGGFQQQDSGAGGRVSNPFRSGTGF
ncbi:vesicular acetylcholine transporter [Condylostylus longicornis]|uniref:vesicular acetylcholine transporter n=1 Tax=Condylostylus longicornis TaxID=2530218 RepID=UPI00244DBF0B|nr:vesicular acetylcholine transporter [Condylostylus longicornis]XP_055380383.1 vesicular acetylcholine transporter [Condylostylus longicornis]